MHTGEKPIKCDYPKCLYKTGDADNMLRHKFTHIPFKAAPTKIFTCTFKGCNYTCPLKQNFNRHLISHMTEDEINEKVASGELKRFVCTSQGCSYVTLYNGDFARHQKTHDSKLSALLKTFIISAD